MGEWASRCIERTTIHTTQKDKKSENHVQSTQTVCDHELIPNTKIDHLTKTSTHNWPYLATYFAPHWKDERSVVCSCVSMICVRVCLCLCLQLQLQG
eukprot:m.928625 g.928625  ORF g.928625 m.928625 type:complete len:97 (-) comp23778_c0_seq1:65-355(-)